MRIFSTRLILPVVLWVLVLVPSSLAIQESTSRKAGEDRVVGTWKLNLAKSRFAGGGAPTSQTRIYEAHPTGIKATVKTSYADGRSTTIEYIAAYDSVEYPLTGSSQYDAIALKRMTDTTAEARLIHAGKEVATAQRVISEDGQTMTITVKTNVGTGEVTNVSVFQRQN
jgi:hypothetical protein